MLVVTANGLPLFDRPCLGLRGKPRPALFFFAPRRVDFTQDRGDIGRCRFGMVGPRQGRFRSEGARLIEGPHLAPIVACRKLWGKAPEEGCKVVDVAHEEGRGAIVRNRAQVLRQVDDDRTRAIQKDVVFGEVTVNNVGTQHARNVAHEGRVDGRRFILGENQVRKPRRGISGIIDDKLHEQYAVHAKIGFGYAYPCVGEREEGADLGVLPDFLPFVTPETRLVGHGAVTSAVAYGPSLLIEHGLSKAAAARFFVNLGAAHALGGLDDEEVGLLAAAQGLNDVVDEPVFE